MVWSLMHFIKTFSQTWIPSWIEKMIMFVLRLHQNPSKDCI